MKILITFSFLFSLASPALALDQCNLTPSMLPAPGDGAYPVYVQPVIQEAESGTHQIFASAYFAPPIVVPGAATVTDAATIFILGAPYADGASNRSLYIYSGDSVVRDKLGVGAVTKPDATLTVFGPGDSNFTAHIKPLNKPAPYGMWLEETEGAAPGYPLLMVSGPGGREIYFRIDSGGRVTFGEKFKEAIKEAAK